MLPETTLDHCFNHHIPLTHYAIPLIDIHENMNCIVCQRDMKLADDFLDPEVSHCEAHFLLSERILGLELKLRMLNLYQNKFGAATLTFLTFSVNPLWATMAGRASRSKGLSPQQSSSFISPDHQRSRPKRSCNTSALSCLDVGLADPGVRLQCGGCDKYLQIEKRKRLQRAQYISRTYECRGPFKNDFMILTAGDEVWRGKVLEFTKKEYDTSIVPEEEPQSEQEDEDTSPIASLLTQPPTKKHKRTVLFTDFTVFSEGQSFVVKKVPNSHMVLRKDEYGHLMDLVKSAEQQRKVIPSDDEQEAAKTTKSALNDVILGSIKVQGVPTSTHSLLAHGTKGLYMKSHSIVSSLDIRINKAIHQGTVRSNMILAAFAASHPNVSPVVLEQIIALSRWTLFLECEGLDCDTRYTLDRMINISPSRTTLEKQVTELAVKQTLIASSAMSAAARVFCQSDAGTKNGRQVKVWTWWDNNDKTKTHPMELFNTSSPTLT